MSLRSETNAELAGRVSAYLVERCGCTVSAVQKGEVFEVHYTFNGEMKPQPAVRIDGSIIFPAGSQEEVVMNFLLG